MSGYDRIPYLILYKDRSSFKNNSFKDTHNSFKDTHKDTHAGEFPRVALKSHLLRPRRRKSATVLVFMHPSGGCEYLPLPVALAGAGHHVICCQSRYPNNDSALIMEKVALDMAACVRDARERLGYEQVVLAGWSGGGALALFYQGQAEHPSVRATPAGDPPDLAEQGLVPADGIMLLASHVGRSHTLTHCLDASILDETDPTRKDPELDIYNPDNFNQPPYSGIFISQYRDAQFARNRRITAWVEEKLESLWAAGKPNREFGFVVHGTMADPKWLDPGIDPNDRIPGRCFLGVPEEANNSPLGIARFCTLRGWLSQWSYDKSNAHGIRCAAQVTVPALVLGNSADNACTPADTDALYRALASRDKTRVVVQGANHCYSGQPEHLQRAVDHARDWLRNKDFAS